MAWLAANPSYIVMTDADCRCAEDLEEIRTITSGLWRAQPAYHPYFVVGDFNGDRKADAAVAVTTDHRLFRVLIVDGGGGGPIYLSPDFKPGEMLFFGAPRPQPWRLLIGRYGTDTVAMLLPHGRAKYVLRYQTCC